MNRPPLTSDASIPEVDIESLRFALGKHVVLADGAMLASGDLFKVVLSGSMALDGQPLRCAGFLPGVTLWLSAGHVRPMDGEDPDELLDYIWQKIRPRLIEWLGMPASPAAVKMVFRDLRLEAGWDDRHRGQAGAMEIEVRHAPEAIAQYRKRRRSQPLVERAPTPEEETRQQQAAIRALLIEAISRSSDTANPKLGRLPGLVRYRVSGAMKAWHAARDALDAVDSQSFTQALRTKGVLTLMRFIDPFIRDILPNGADGFDAMQVRMIAQYSIIWLAFEVRHGVFYEPTPPLHRLLDDSYIADDVPVGMITLPADTVCIIPEPSRWKKAGDVEAIAIFRTEQTLDLVAWTCQDSATTGAMDVISLSLDDPDKTIHALLDESFRNSWAPEDAETLALWRGAMDYSIKMLLYLNARDAQIVHEQAYTKAPRQFNGLGKRRRAELLAEIEQLYDRHIVGPAILDAGPAPSLGGDGEHHEVRGHWRRPHFRMQPHGPQAALRKLIFVGPTIVRPDRLN